MSNPPIPVHPNVKSPGTTVDTESSPVASTSLVPLPRNLKEAIPATFTWLWGDKSADGERSLVVFCLFVFSLNDVFILIFVIFGGGFGG